MKLTEKKSYPYIYVDTENKVHVLVPLSSGQLVGLDNTCKAALEIKKFIAGDEGSRQNILSVIEQYVRDLETDLLFLTTYLPDSPEVQSKNHRLEQLRAYYHLWRRLITRDLLDEFSRGIPEFPPSITRALQSNTANCVSILLDPVSNDSFTRFHGHLFSLCRDRYHHQGLKATLYRELQAQYRANIAVLKTPKQLLIESIVNKFRIRAIQNDTDLNALKSLIVQELSPHIREETLRDKDYSYFVATCVADNRMPISEWVENIFNSSIDDTVIADIATPFQTVVSPRDPFEHYDPFEEFSVKVQLLLGLVNLFQFQRLNNRRNFGQLLENDGSLLASFITALRRTFDRIQSVRAIEQDVIERCVFEFINRHDRAFQCSLTTDDMVKLSKEFKIIWNSIKESPHFDEFLLFLPDKSGDFYAHNGLICLSTAAYVREQNQELYRSNFNSSVSSLSPVVQCTSHLLLPNTVTSESLEITLKQLLTFEPDVIVSFLLAPHDDTNLIFKTLNNAERQSIKMSSKWPEIVVSLYNRDLSQTVIDEFATLFEVQPGYVLDLVGVQALYTEIAFRFAHEPHKNPMLNLSGIKKLTAALQFLGIEFSQIRFNEAGNYFIEFTTPEQFVCQAQSLLRIKKDNESRFHITNSMSPSFYKAAEALRDDIRVRLGQLDNQVLDPTQSKMAYTLRQLLDLPADGVVPATSTPGRGQIRINYHGKRGYEIIGDPQLIKRLNQIYHSRLTQYLDTEELTLLLGDKPRTKENIETFLNDKQIAFYGVRQIGEQWAIVMESEESKNKLAKAINEVLDQRYATEDSPSPDLRVILSDKTFNKIAQYHADLFYQRKKPGQRLAALLPAGKFWCEISSTEFAEMLVRSQMPVIFAETSTELKQWNETELNILGDISFAINVLLRGNGARGGQIPYKNFFKSSPTPFLLVNGPLQRSSMPDKTPDYKEIWSDTCELKLDAFCELIERRLLGVLLHANKLGEEQNRQVFITMPGLGCGQFAPVHSDENIQRQIKDTVADALETAVERILRRHLQKFPKISGIYLDTWNRGTKREGKTIQLNREGQASLDLYLKYGATDSEPHAQLEAPKKYGEKYEHCLFMSVIAADHVSWPGNDMYKLSPSTDEGAKANASNLIPQVLRDCINKMSDEEIRTAGKNLVSLLLETDKWKVRPDTPTLLKTYAVWLEGIQINGRNVVDFSVQETLTLISTTALLELPIADYRKMLFNAAQDTYSAAHHQSYPKSATLYLNQQKDACFKGLNWEELIKASGINLHVRNCIYVCDDQNQLKHLKPQMLPMTFNSKPLIAYDKLVQQEKAPEPASSFVSLATSMMFSKPSKNEAPQPKKLQCTITAQMAASLYLYANENLNLTDAETKASAPHGDLLRIILEKIYQLFGLDNLDRNSVTLLDSGFTVHLDAVVWDQVIAIDIEQRKKFDDKLTNLIFVHLYGNDQTNFAAMLKEFCGVYMRQLLNKNNLLQYVWQQVKELFVLRNRADKFDVFYGIIIAEAQRQKDMKLGVSSAAPAVAAVSALPASSPAAATTASVSSASALAAAAAAACSPAFSPAAAAAASMASVLSTSSPAASAAAPAQSPARTQPRP